MQNALASSSVSINPASIHAVGLFPTRQDRDVQGVILQSCGKRSGRALEVF